MGTRVHVVPVGDRSVLVSPRLDPPVGESRRRFPLGSTLPLTAEPVAVRPILCKARRCPEGTNQEDGNNGG
jgi:hypothetical protein